MAPSKLMQVVANAAGIPTKAVPLNGAYTATISLEIAAGEAKYVNDFIVQVQARVGGPWLNFVGGADWQSTTVAPMIVASNPGLNQVAGAPQPLKFGVVRVYGFYAIRFVPKSSGADFNVDIYVGLNGM